MRCVSTRGGPSVPLTEAITRGLAPDGGLYMVEPLPAAPTVTGDTLAARAVSLLRPFFDGEPLAPHLAAIVEGAFTFDAPTRWLDADTGQLELFHGPTAAFKDFGARFLAECLARLPHQSGRPLTVLVATSGDTGAAVASAFHRREGFQVVMLYPDGRVSRRQAHRAGRLRRQRHHLPRAGHLRRLPAHGEGRLFQPGAARAGASPRPTASASGACCRSWPTTHTLHLRRARPANPRCPSWCPPATWATASPACSRASSGSPSPTWCSPPTPTGCSPTTSPPASTSRAPRSPRWPTRWTSALPATSSGCSTSSPTRPQRRRRALGRRRDDSQTIAGVEKEHGLTLCPHTACGFEVLRRLRAGGAKGPYLVAATAHPAKFDDGGRAGWSVTR